jgi:hypothetical protein
MAANLIITAEKRVPFLEDVAITHLNYTSATFKMQIRANAGDEGAAIIELTGQTAGSEGISVTYNAAYEYVDNAGSTVTAPASIILIQIDEATIEALALGTPANEPVTLYYDLHITGGGLPKHIPIAGKFIINPGVTI